MEKDDQINSVKALLPDDYAQKVSVINDFGIRLGRKADLDGALTELKVAPEIRQELLERAMTYEGGFVVFDPLGDGEGYLVVGEDPGELVDEAMRHFGLDESESAPKSTGPMIIK